MHLIDKYNNIKVFMTAKIVWIKIKTFTLQQDLLYLLFLCALYKSQIY